MNKNIKSEMALVVEKLIVSMSKSDNRALSDMK